MSKLKEEFMKKIKMVNTNFFKILFFVIGMFVFSQSTFAIGYPSKKLAEIKIQWTDQGQLIQETLLKDLRGPSYKSWQNQVKVWEPHAQKVRVYHALNLIEFLNKFFGPTWKKAHGLSFTCRDGYIAHIPLKEIRRYQPMLAYSMVNGEDFRVDNLKQNEKDVNLGPLYLVWNNLRYSKLKAQGAKNWPYQIVAINLERKDPLLALRPDKHASSQIKQGHKIFAKNCLTCHAINKLGGQKGPDLSEIISLKSEAEIKAYILDPRKLNPDSIMPAMFEKKSKKMAQRQIQFLYEYLKFQIQSKK